MKVSTVSGLVALFLDTGAITSQFAKCKEDHISNEANYPAIYSTDTSLYAITSGLRLDSLKTLKQSVFK